MDGIWEKIESTGTLPLPSFGHTATKVSKTKIVLFGGATGGDGKYSMTDDTYIFTTFKNEWSKLNGIYWLNKI